MRVVFITRSTLFKVKGGDTVQAVQTAKHLNDLGIDVEIKLAHEKIDYNKYDLLHFFNIIRPADILTHIKRTKKPFVLSPVFLIYSEYDKHYRKGLAGLIFKILSPGGIEYIKTIGRWIKGNDKLPGISYLWKGHKRSMKEILKNAKFILPNSNKEFEQIVKSFSISPAAIIVPNGVEIPIFQPDDSVQKDPNLVLCVARVEGNKNQINLIRALSNTSYRLIIIGASAPNQPDYYNQCKRIAGPNVSFINRLPIGELVQYYRKAKVHILPSWFETCGLSSLEAAAMGCNVVITNRGFASEYFEDLVYYCDPASPASIFRTVEIAARSETKKELQEKIFRHYTWQQAAIKTAEAYSKVITT